MTTEAGRRPGERRFHDLLERERHDVAMLAHHLAVIYDDLTGGLVSKPNTKPEVVVDLYYERMQREVAEAVAAERERIRAAVIDGLVWSVDDPTLRALRDADA